MLLGNGCRLLAVAAPKLFGVFHLERLGSNAALLFQLEWHEALQAGRI